MSKCLLILLKIQLIFSIVFMISILICLYLCSEFLSRNKIYICATRNLEICSFSELDTLAQIENLVNSKDTLLNRAILIDRQLRDLSHRD